MFARDPITYLTIKSMVVTQNEYAIKDRGPSSMQKHLLLDGTISHNLIQLTQFTVSVCLEHSQVFASFTFCTTSTYLTLSIIRSAFNALAKMQRGIIQNKGQLINITNH